MYIDAVPNRRSPPAVLLRESVREGARVLKRTLANLSDWAPAKVDALRHLLRDEPLVSPEQAFEIERSLPHGHVEVVLGLMRKLGLPEMLAAKRHPQRSSSRTSVRPAQGSADPSGRRQMPAEPSCGKNPVSRVAYLLGCHWLGACGAEPVAP